MAAYSREGSLSRYQMGPFERMEVRSSTTIAFVSGDVPRLVILDGSDSWSIYEGQSLPVSDKVVRICNPYPVQVEVVIGYGLPVVHNVVASDTSLRYVDRTQGTTQHDYSETDAVKRTGVALTVVNENGADLPEVEVYFQAVQPTAGKLRVDIFRVNGTQFLIQKPAGALTGNVSAVYATGEAMGNVRAVGGQFTDADVTTWKTAGSFAARGLHYVQSHDFANASNRFVIFPGSVALFSRDPGASFAGRVVVRQLGRRAADYD